MNRKKIILTTGDTDGIGLEVTLKSFLDPAVKIPKNFQFIILHGFFDTKQDNKNISALFKKFRKKRRPVFTDNLDEALSADAPFVECVSISRPPFWVEAAAIACFHKKAHAMVTGPLSKPLIKECGMKDLGHTEILKRICKIDHAYMSFWGKYFSVVLATGHCSVSQISKKISELNLEKSILETTSLLPKQILKKPIALLGLNPHAGDRGLIGHEENLIHRQLLEKLQKTHSHLKIEGPLVPDAAFVKSNWNRYSFYVANYHDQGLIPFKMAHGYDSGVHMTVGLPFIRTSVDHGTAKDIFGKNKARHGSMKEAIQFAIKLLNTK